MNFENCKFYRDFYTSENVGVISADGNSSCSLQDQAYLAWLDEGNQPEAADEIKGE
jgi:hypothetical protein